MSELYKDSSFGTRKNYSANDFNNLTAHEAEALVANIQKSLSSLSNVQRIEHQQYSNSNLRVVKAETAPSGESVQLVRPLNVDGGKTSDEIVGDLVGNYDYKRNNVVHASQSDLTYVEQAFGSNLTSELLNSYEGSKIVTDNQQDLIGDRYLAEQIKRIEDQQKKQSVIDKYAYLLYDGEKSEMPTYTYSSNIYSSISTSSFQPAKQDYSIYSSSNKELINDINYYDYERVDQDRVEKERQERLRFEQERARVDQLIQDELRSEQLRLQEAARQEQHRVDEANRQEQLRLEEQLRQEHLRNEQLVQEQEQLRQEQLRQEQLREERDREEQLRQIRLIEDRLRQQEEQLRKSISQHAFLSASSNAQNLNNSASRTNLNAQSLNNSASRANLNAQSLNNSASRASLNARNFTQENSQYFSSDINSVTLDAAYNDPQFKAMLELMLKPFNLSAETVELEAQWPSQDKLSYLAEPIVIPAPEPLVIPAPDIIKFNEKYMHGGDNISEDVLKPTVTYFPSLNENDLKFYKDFGLGQLNLNSAK